MLTAHREVWAAAEQEFVKRVRRVDLDSSLRGAEVALIPAPGTHWFLRGRRPYLVSFYRSEDESQKVALYRVRIAAPAVCFGAIWAVGCRGELPSNV